MIHAAGELQRVIPDTFRNQDVITRNTANCRDREENFRKCYREAVEALLVIGTSQKTHWRYDITALRMMRALVQRDLPNDSPQVEYLLSKVTNDHPSLRYVRLSLTHSCYVLNSPPQYAQRALMKMLRYIKVRTNTSRPEDISCQINRNPLRRQIPMKQPSPATTKEYLASFAVPLDWNVAKEKPCVKYNIFK